MFLFEEPSLIRCESMMDRLLAYFLGGRPHVSRVVLLKLISNLLSPYDDQPVTLILQEQLDQKLRDNYSQIQAQLGNSADIDSLRRVLEEVGLSHPEIESIVIDLSIISDSLHDLKYLSLFQRLFS